VIKFLDETSLRHDRNLFKGTGYPDRATIYEEPAAGSEDMGEAAPAEYPDDWTVFLENEPCRFYPTQANFREGLTSSQIQEQADFRALLRADLPRPPAKARVRIISSGVTLDFEIVGIKDSSDKIATVLELKRAK